MARIYVFGYCQILSSAALAEPISSEAIAELLLGCPRRVALAEFLSSGTLAEPSKRSHAELLSSASLAEPLFSEAIAELLSLAAIA